jgi:hypothetical protein
MSLFWLIMLSRDSTFLKLRWLMSQDDMSYKALSKINLLLKGQAMLIQFSSTLCGDNFCDLGNNKIPHLSSSSI